ncbi:murein transglycosylase A [Roseicella frigidaeris]|uniref:peptidoglycan lytic exotransglycosylase n=1 Tax=Roseicella frigidaeris TaxID=2230885 RepID=A0A327M475_9PROT|nr:MltA domain-containing protein [Roseicella frigidaeris]RAI57750.1 murein transglycosylase [Roseicella frigidaeris]
MAGPAWAAGCRRLLLSALLLGGAAGLAWAAPPGLDSLPGWAEEDAAAALVPFRATCRELARRDPEAPLGGQPLLAARAGRPAAWALLCAEALALPAGAERAFLERRLEPVPVGTGLLTGYYEPELSGRLTPDAAHPTPLHGLPPAAAEGGLLPDRAAIEAGALDGIAPILVHVDPVEGFFLQIQGSGRVTLPEGGLLRLRYAGKNGHPYRAIGRLLIERGAIAREAISMQAIRAWLAAAPPPAAAALLRENPSYVFFRRDEALRPDEGPPGTLGVPLTPGRSLAVDPAFIPLGAPVWIVTQDPLDGRPIRRLVQAQDTGGAIRGAARGDLFFGWGEEAAARAGLMQAPVTMMVLVPREGAAP